MAQTRTRIWAPRVKPFPVIFVVGPTAVGKSDFALRAAEKFNGVILNCDSVQTYSHISIGAAKPDQSTRDRVPHYLLDWVKPPHRLTAAEFRREALENLEVLTKNKTVFAVGGSGFYIRALEKGLYPVRKVPREIAEAWQKRMQEQGSVALYEILKQQDPQYATKLSPNDGYRIQRALETMETEGRTLTTIQREFAENSEPLPYRTLKIGFELPRQELRGRIARRAQNMIQAGLRQEVEELMRLQLEEWAPLNSVGYKEMKEGIRQGSSDQVIAEQISLSTSQLAKKQMTWFKGDKDVHWFTPQPADAPSWIEPMALVGDFLSRD